MKNMATFAWTYLSGLDLQNDSKIHFVSLENPKAVVEALENFRGDFDDFEKEHKLFEGILCKARPKYTHQMWDMRSYLNPEDAMIRERESLEGENWYDNPARVFCVGCLKKLNRRSK